MVWRILQYIRHQFYFRKRRGYGIHSPYLFGFINQVLFNGKGVKVPLSITQEHRRLKEESTMIGTGSPGMASKVAFSDKRTAASFVKGSSVSERYGALLHRIISWFEPEMIVELGTGLGISTMYMSSAAPETPLHSIEGNRERAAFAAQLINRCCPGPVSVHRGDIDEKLEDILPLLPMVKGRFVAFLDGNHHSAPTLKYTRKLIEQAGDEAVIILDDIYWSRGMCLAWKQISQWPEVRVSIDLFHMGILLLRRDLYKTSLKIMF